MSSKKIQNKFKSISKSPKVKDVKPSKNILKEFYSEEEVSTKKEELLILEKVFQLLKHEEAKNRDDINTAIKKLKGFIINLPKPIDIKFLRTAVSRLEGIANQEAMNINQLELSANDLREFYYKTTGKPLQ